MLTLLVRLPQHLWNGETACLCDIQIAHVLRAFFMCTRRGQITQLCFWLIDGRSEIFWAFVSLLNPTLKTIKTPPPAVKYGDEIWKLSYTERNNNALLLSLLINSCCSTSQIVILLKYLCGKDVQFTTDEYYWKRIRSSCTFTFINTLGPV